MPSPRLGSGASILGTVKPELTDPTPTVDSATWESDAGRVSVQDPPPPWEVNEGGLSLSDARRFVGAPDNLMLRWINPRVLDAEGWRDWQPVMASDPRFTIRVHTMVSPEGNIRRGGQNGDILAWMLRSWVESKRRAHDKDTAQLTASAVDKQRALEDASKRGEYGPYVRIDGAKHPTHTIGEGRTMKD